MKKIGVTIGKFMPLHMGHETMIEFAARQLDKLIIIVSSNPIAGDEFKGMDLETRYELIKNKYAGRKNIKVVMYYDVIGDPVNVDENGTALDEEFWEMWLGVFKRYAPRATHFVSSDRYGKEAAKRLGITWMPVDPDRELVNISATEIRNDPVKNCKYLSKEFRKFFVKRVVVIGPESSGKSTLVKDLGKFFSSPAVPEYGRIKTEQMGDEDWTEQDFIDIVSGQQTLNDIAATQTDNGLVFIDTEAYTTFLYGREYIQRSIWPIYDEATIFEEFDLYVLLPPAIPWDDDGTRVMPGQGQRQQFFDDLFLFLRNSEKPFFVCTETGRNARVSSIASKMAEHFEFISPVDYKIA